MPDNNPFDLPDPSQALPLLHALHPSLPHLATCDASGHLQILDLDALTPLNHHSASLDHASGLTLAIGGPPSRPLVAWIDPSGTPHLWAYTAKEGLAASPCPLPTLARFRPEISGARFDALWLTSAGSRTWAVLSASPSGGLIANGRLILIRDPHPHDATTDPLGPCLLAEIDAACPLPTLVPTTLQLPLGFRRPRLRHHPNLFTPATRLRWTSPQTLSITWAGPDLLKPADLRIDRQSIRVDLSLDPPSTPATPLPSTLDFETIALDDHPDGPRWLSPQPNGATLHAQGHDRPLSFIPTSSLPDLTPLGHPRCALALSRLGLRWDGTEVTLDTLRADALSRLGDPDSSTRTGPVRPDTRVEGHSFTLLADSSRADRLLLLRPPSRPSPRVLPHPVLNLIPDHVRRRPLDRPRVDLLASAIDALEDYLAVWRRPGGVELWSLRAGDRLKAWPFPAAPGQADRRLILIGDDPDYLPELLILEAPAPPGDADRAVLVARVEFGDPHVQPLGHLLIPPTTRLDDLSPLDPDRRRWSLNDTHLTLK